MKYDLIHCAVFVFIKLFVMLCEYLIKNWMNSRFAVGLLVDPLLCSKSSSILNIKLINTYNAMMQLFKAFEIEFVEFVM